jgi:hypothetical protein
VPLKLPRVAGLALQPAGIRVIAKSNLDRAGTGLAVKVCDLLQQVAIFGAVTIHFEPLATVREILPITVGTAW